MEPKVFLVVAFNFIEGHVCYLADNEYVTDNIHKAKLFPLDTKDFGIKGVKFETFRVNE